MGSTPSPLGSASKPMGSKPSAKDKEKKNFSAGYRYVCICILHRVSCKMKTLTNCLFSSGDDDINDVAAMGGVNLAEESQRILGSTEFVGTQIRSIRDETFLHAVPLQARLKAIGKY